MRKSDREILRRLYPFENHYLDLGALRYHYLDEGTGDPIVMVHGNPTWSFYFRKLVLGLRDSYRCIVPDHIGCGLSDKPGDDGYEYTLSRRADDLESLLGRLGLDRGITFLMHDWGGMIGMICAMRRPERVARIIALNTAAFLKPPAKKMPWPLWVVHRRNGLSALLVQGLNVFSIGATISATVKGMSREVRRGLTAPYDSWSNRIATLRFVQDAPLLPSDRSYAVAKALDEGVYQFANRPMLICWGKRDWVFDHHFLAEWRRRFPKAEVHTFPHAGHYVLEDAGDEILRLVREFLKRNPIGDGGVQKGGGEVVQAAAPGDDPHRGLDEMVNVATYLPAMARQVPDRPAIAWVTGRDAAGRASYAHWTFRQLDEEADRYAHGLEHTGIKRGMRTILMVRPCPEFFALVFALFKVGAVVVLIDPGMGRQRMVECLSAVNAEAFMGLPLAHMLRVLHPAAFGSVRISITVGRRWFWGGLRLADVRAAAPAQPYETAPTRRDEPAAIIFTTGSTGPPKGVLYQHGMFDGQVRILREHLRIEPGEIDLPTFPLFALFDPALGMTTVIPDMDPTKPAWVDPEKIVRAIRDWKVTNMFGSPALLNRIGRYAQANNIKLPTLRRVVSAGAPASPAVLERFAAILNDDAEIHTPYGATEALPVASIGSREILRETCHESRRGGGACVGRPMPGIEVRVIKITEEPIEQWSDELVVPAGEIGEVAVRGLVVSPGYCTDAAATRLAKIRDCGAVWHRMGDVGRFDEEGRLWFCGRKAHRVITEQGTLFTVPCEAVFNQHPLVFRSALVGVGPAPRQRPVICVELELANRNADRAKLTQELLDLGRKNELTVSIDTVLFHPAFPVDIRHNAKIFREQLAVWATEQLRAR